MTCLPSFIIKMRELRFSASSICCVETRMLICEPGDLARETKIDQIFSLDFKSKFEVGSSIINKVGFPTKAIAIVSFLFSP